MAETIKVIGSQVALTATGNTIGSASVVRVSLISSGNALITRQYANAATIGTVFLGSADPTIVLIKSPDDLLIANATNLAVATPISYT